LRASPDRDGILAATGSTEKNAQRQRGRSHRRYKRRRGVPQAEILRRSDPEHDCTGNRTEKNHRPSADQEPYDDGWQDYQERRHAVSVALCSTGGGA